MTDSWKSTPVSFRRCFYLILSVVLLVGCDSAAKKKLAADKEQARAQVERIAQKLDTQTTETGVYIRNEDVNEKDPWNQAIKVTYSQGGVSEAVEVRSSGPDKTLHTSDDIIASRASMNFKGAGEGIKKNIKEVASEAAKGAGEGMKENAQEVAAEAAKGVVKGTVDGVKESVKGSLPFLKKKKKADDPEANDKPESKDDPAPEKETSSEEKEPADK